MAGETVGVENAAKPVIRGIIEDWRGDGLGKFDSEQPSVSEERCLK
jgi:hypothetical protein